MSRKGATALLVWVPGVLLGLAARTSAEPSITLTSPAGGETWSAGSKHFLTWKADIFPVGAELRITYSTDGGKAWAVIAGTAPNNGRYLWKVPDTVSKDCKVRLAAGGAGRDHLIPSTGYLE